MVDVTAHRLNVSALRGLNNLASMTSETDPRASWERTKLGIATARRLGLRAFDGYHAGNATGVAEPLGEWAWLRATIGAMLDGERDPIEAEWLESTRDYFDVWTGTPDVARAERLLEIARQDNDFQSERNLVSYLSRCAFSGGDPGRSSSRCPSRSFARRCARTVSTSSSSAGQHSTPAGSPIRARCWRLWIWSRRGGSPRRGPSSRCCGA